MKSRLLLSAILATLLLVGACNDDDPSDPFADCGENCIGPGGGTMAITSPDHPLYGVRIDVPPGMWDREWAVYLGYETTFTTPNFPDGLEGYANFMTGSLNLEIIAFAPPDQQPALPDSLYMEITFPIRDLVCETGEIITAFRYDDAVQRWCLELPDARTDTTITVHTYDHAPLWTWGIVTLHEVDWDLYLAPVMVEEHGADGWTELQLELQEMYDSIVENDLWISCATLDLVRDGFAAVKADAELGIVAHQDGLGTLCGVCDVRTSTFRAEYIEYITLNIEAFLLEFFLVDNGPSLLIQAYGFMRMCETLAEIDDLACDYECFFDHADTEFYDNMAMYYVACIVIEAIEYAKTSGYISCPS